MKYTKTNFRIIVFLSLCAIVILFLTIAVAFDLRDSGTYLLFIVTIGVSSGIYYYYKAKFIKNGANMSSKPQDLMEHKSTSFSESEEIPLQRIATSNLVVFSDGITYEFLRKDAIGNYWFKDHFTPFSKSFSLSPQEVTEKAIKLVGPKGIKWQTVGCQLLSNS